MTTNRRIETARFWAELNGLGVVILFVVIVGLAYYFWSHRNDHVSSEVIFQSVQDLADIETMRDAGIWTEPSPYVYDWANDERRTG